MYINRIGQKPRPDKRKRAKARGKTDEEIFKISCPGKQRKWAVVVFPVANVKLNEITARCTNEF